MSDQAGLATKIPRYAYTLADKNCLLDYSERDPKVNAVDLGTVLAEYVNSEVSANAINSKGYNAAHRWFHHSCARPRTRAGSI
jgi:hypothetical protein